MANAQTTVRETEWLRSDPIDEEEFHAMVSRDELRTMVDQVGEMYQGWDKIQLELARLNKNSMMTNARQIDLEGRVALLERGAVVSENTTGHEVTERRTNVRIPVRRAAELLDSEKREKALSVMLERYQWWTGTARQAAWGFSKLVGKYVTMGALGFAAKVLYDIWTKR